MNKNILMVLAIIVALLSGWLLLSVAVTTQPETEEQMAAASRAIPGPEVPVPSRTEIKVTVVDGVESSGTDITAQVRP